MDMSEDQREYEESLDAAEAGETNNCNKCGVELDGPWDEFCPSCERSVLEFMQDTYGTDDLGVAGPDWAEQIATREAAHNKKAADDMAATDAASEESVR